MNNKSPESVPAKAETAGEAATTGEETLDEPVMDGATETFAPDADPRKGYDDPALIRHVDTGKKTTNPYG